MSYFYFMKNKLLYIAVLFAVSVISVIVFVPSSWYFFLGDSCLLEVLLMLVGGVVIACIGYFKCPPKSKKQVLRFFGIVLLNLAIVIPPIINHRDPYMNISAFIILHGLLLFLMYFLEKRMHFLLSACYMVYGSAIAYRLNTIGYFFHDVEGLLVGNFEMLISVFVLFSISSALILFKRFPEE